MEALHRHAFGCQHVVDLAACGLGHGAILVVKGVPAGIARKEMRHVRHVSLDVNLGIARRHDMADVARGVSGRRDCSNPGNDVLARLVGRDLAADGIEHAAGVLEDVLHTAGRRPAHLAVIHEVFPFDCWHQHLGLGECQLPRGIEDAVDVVAVEMRDQHDVDCAAVDAGSLEVGLELPAGTLAGGERRLADAGIDRHQFGAGVDHDGVIGRGHHIGRIECGGEPGVDLLA